jgi:hypothetical protein
MDSFEQEIQERQKEIEREEIERNAEVIVAFTAHCAERGCQLTDSHFAYADVTGVTANSTGIVRTLYPELMADKDGLYSLRTLQDMDKPVVELSPISLAGGYVQTSNCVLFAHPLFRRQYYKDNNWAPSFINRFWRLREPAIVASIALDLDRVRIDLDGGAYFEKDRWLGASFKQDIAAIPDDIVQLRPSAEFEGHPAMRLFNNVFSLDIEWRTAAGIKTFYAEEFLDEEMLVNYGGADYFPTRYIHAEFDVAGGYFRHFDGAIHFYDIEDYMNRRDSDFNYNRKNPNPIKARSLKLFRLDGRVSVETWMELTTHFLSHDPLIIEYFTGSYPEPLEQIRQRLRS